MGLHPQLPTLGDIPAMAHNVSACAEGQGAKRRSWFRVLGDGLRVVGRCTRDRPNQLGPEASGPTSCN